MCFPRTERQYMKNIYQYLKMSCIMYQEIFSAGVRPVWKLEVSASRLCPKIR
jgi:hypothetical protein